MLLAWGGVVFACYGGGLRGRIALGRAPAAWGLAAAIKSRNAPCGGLGVALSTAFYSFGIYRG